MQRRLRALSSEADAAKVTLGEGKKAAKDEAITLPLNGDMQLLNLGDLFPTFAPTQPSASEGSGPAHSHQQVGRHGQLEAGLLGAPHSGRMHWTLSQEAL